MNRRVAFNLVGPKHWRPLVAFYRMYGGWMWACGPLTVTYYDGAALNG
jgi:hypothetical protein